MRWRKHRAFSSAKRQDDTMTSPTAKTAAGHRNSRAKLLKASVCKIEANKRNVLPHCKNVKWLESNILIAACL